MTQDKPPVTVTHYVEYQLTLTDVINSVSNRLSESVAVIGNVDEDSKDSDSAEKIIERLAWQKGYLEGSTSALSTILANALYHAKHE